MWNFYILYFLIRNANKLMKNILHIYEQWMPSSLEKQF